MAAAPTSELGKFEGKPVHGTRIAVTRAGDGLSEAMKVDPIILHQGDTVYVVLECAVDKVRFDPIDKTDGVARVHLLKAGTATLIDGDAVRSALDEQRERITLAKEADQGVQRIGFDLAAAHAAGEHEDSPVDECTACWDAQNGAIPIDRPAKKARAARKPGAPRRRRNTTTK